LAETDYTHTPATRHEDLTALANLPAAKVSCSRRDRAHTARPRTASASRQWLRRFSFQISAAVRTPSGGLIAPVFWSDNWIELVPGESRTLTALLPDSAPGEPIVQIGGWNIASETITVPRAAIAAH
jgi:exo-1,4-beta-D-glucosaminidase